MFMHTWLNYQDTFTSYFQVDMELLSVRLLLIFCMTESLNAGSSFNIALHQPAYQKSNYGHRYASRAVDGNRNTNMDRHSCTCTNRNYQPWWSVDLGAIYHVTRVTLVNRNSWVNRLNNLNVGVMNSRPTTQLQSSSYDLCATFPGPGRASQVIVLNCEQVCIYSPTVA